MALGLAAGAVVVDLPEVEVAIRGLAESLAKDRRRHGAAQVGEGAGRRRHRDPVLVGRSVAGQVRGAVEADSSAVAAASSGGNGDVDGREERRQELPEARCAFVGEDGPVAARQDRRQPSPLTGQPAMSHRVDAAMQAVQPAGADAVGRRFVVDAAGSELGRGQNAMLASRDGRGSRVGGGGFLRHILSKPPRGRSRPPA